MVPFCISLRRWLTTVTDTLCINFWCICLRLERFGWNSSAGKAKVFGTLLGIGGAMLLTFYKGPDLNLWHTNINLLETTKSHQHPSTQIQNHNLVLGALLTFCSCVCYSIWLIVQVRRQLKKSVLLEAAFSFILSSYLHCQHMVFFTPLDFYLIFLNKSC